ncbi:MAG: Stp1/IreP family PP2C-type Ser/Thr phosphatase [Acetatifactor sp.]|nr:Stp1/IreP family PP2C-type Ser/Thr phosphatase [Acetatifactor sp.]
MVRKLNQDYVYRSELPVGNLPNLFLVADGMGGHNAGDFAAKLAVTTIAELIADSDETDAEKLLDRSVSVANAVVFRSAEASPELAGMGTTIVAAVCDGDKLTVANVGDSRLYVVNKDGINQITRDHSWVEEMIRRGGIAREDARNHPDKNIITRAVGVGNSVRIDFFEHKIKEDDIILMCTDGLTNMLIDEEIQSVLLSERNIEEKAEELVRRANDNGGRDNISVILIQPFA